MQKIQKTKKINFVIQELPLWSKPIRRRSNGVGSSPAYKTSFYDVSFVVTILNSIDNRIEKNFKFILDYSTTHYIWTIEFYLSKKIQQTPYVYWI